MYLNTHAHTHCPLLSCASTSMCWSLLFNSRRRHSGWPFIATAKWNFNFKSQKIHPFTRWEGDCLLIYLQYVWLSVCECNPESWVTRRGAAAETHTPDDLLSRPEWGGCIPLGSEHPHQAGMTRAPLRLHSVHDKPGQSEKAHTHTHTLC